MEQLHSTTNHDNEAEYVDPVDVEQGIDALELHANQAELLGKKAAQITAFEHFAKGTEQLEPVVDAKHKPPKPPKPPKPVTKPYKTGPFLNPDT